jgi:hypothetical protein
MWQTVRRASEARRSRVGSRKIALVAGQRRSRIAALVAMPILALGLSGPGCSGSAKPHEHTASGRPQKHLTVRSAAPIRLPVIVTTRGPNDPHDFDLSLLIPHGARLRQVWFIHGGRQPDQVLVEWIRSRTVSLYGYEFSDTVRWGLILWTQTPPRPANYQAPWKGVAIPLLKLAPGAPNMRVGLADVTSDGHPDVLVEQYPHTNHGCGPHQVVATLTKGITWRIFRASLCETTLHGIRGLLALDLPYYVNGDSVCCWSKVGKLRLHWNGHRYIRVSDRIVHS